MTETIRCRTCGKKKPIQRLGKRKSSWKCNTCKKATHPKVTILCASCDGSTTLRAKCVTKCDYYLCGPCNKARNFIHPELAPGELRCCIMNAAGGYKGFSIEIASQEDRIALENAKAIFALGLDENKDILH